VQFDNGLDTLLLPTWLRRFGPLRNAPGSMLDRLSLHYYTLYAALGAVLTGTFSGEMALIVLKKSLNASPLEIGVMAAIGPMSLLLGIVGAEMVRGRDRRPVLLALGLVSRGVFLLFAFCTAAWQFIVITSTFYVGNAMLIPAITSQWQNNISARSRNRLWGLTVSITTAISMAFALLVGWALKNDHDAYRWILPIAGMAGLAGVLVLVRMPYRGRYKHNNPPLLTVRQALISPLKTIWALLRDDRDFRHFEAAFFLYGCAFMIMVPILPVYIVDLAQMDYVEASVGAGVLFPAAAIALSTYWARKLDRATPSRLCTQVFVLLALFPLLLLLGPSLAVLGMPMAYTVYLSYAVYGIGMSGLGIAWNLAPLSFAGSRDATSYTGAHVTLTGVRGAIAPITGALALEELGYQPVLIAAVFLFLVAAAGMYWLELKLRRRKAATRTAASI
jgi:MFS family permease